tara:strand:+ start:3517 stop:4440 length:924 start_codon:yes stop_codon:yes gene_type:complete
MSESNDNTIINPNDYVIVDYDPFLETTKSYFPTYNLFIDVAHNVSRNGNLFVSSQINLMRYQEASKNNIADILIIPVTTVIGQGGQNNDSIVESIFFNCDGDILQFTSAAALTQLKDVQAKNNIKDLFKFLQINKHIGYPSEDSHIVYDVNLKQLKKDNFNIAGLKTINVLHLLACDDKKAIEKICKCNELEMRFTINGINKDLDDDLEHKTKTIFQAFYHSVYDDKLYHDSVNQIDNFADKEKRISPSKIQPSKIQKTRSTGRKIFRGILYFIQFLFVIALFNVEGDAILGGIISIAIVALVLKNT